MLSEDRNHGDSFNKIYTSLFPVIYRVAYRITGDEGIAEDLCHESFIKYLERDQGLPDIEQTKYWLLRVVRNISLNFEKRKSRERNAVEKLKKRPPPVEKSSEEQVLIQEEKSAVQAMLNDLPYKLRVVLVLKEYGELNYRQIGSILGITEGNVKVRIYRARERLAKLIKKGNIYVP